jgi:Mrp family chromosome partitioning ATPase/uncharacterized protein involved in exopolysaccharide biosynthesis
MSGKEQVARVLDVLFRRKWSLLSGFAAVLLSAIVYSLLTKPQYEAVGFVLVDLGKVSVDIELTDPSRVEGADAGFELFARSDRTLAGEIRLLRISDQLMQRVVQRLRIEDELDLDANAEPPAILRGRVLFEPESGSENIIRFIGLGSEAERAARLANLYAEEYVLLTREASRANALGLTKTLEEKEREQREELDRVEEQIRRLQSGAVDLDKEATRLVEQIASLETQHDDARVEFQVESAALVSLERELAEINPQLAQRIASGVERRIEALQRELDKDEAARADFIIRNPELEGRETDALRSIDQRIQRIRGEIDSLSVQYVNEVAAAGGLSGSADGLSYVARLRQQIAEKRVGVSRMEAKLAVLDSRLQSYRSAQNNLPKQSMEFAQLERSRVRAEMMYQNTMKQLQDAYLAQESEPGYAQIIRRALVPERPISPDTQRNLILGIFFGLLVGLVLAIVQDKFDNRIYQTEQLRQMGQKEIGIVPNLRPILEKEYRGRPFVEHNGQRVSSSLIPLHQPISPTSEAYRYLRTNLEFGFLTRQVHTLVITSPGMSEGKSTTAANLAIVLAQSGRRTLLVDADLRRPRQHRLFGRPLTPGLTERLLHGTNADAATWETSIENLSLLPAGRIDRPGANGSEPNDVSSSTGVHANPSELLGSRAMQDLLAGLRDSFDTIVIDTPPVLAVSDAALLSARGDAVLVVVRAGTTKAGDLTLALETLEDVGATVFGVLLNGFDIQMAYGQSYRFRHYHGYANGSAYVDVEVIEGD